MSRQDQLVAAKMTSVERALTCRSISEQQLKIVSEAKILEDKIKANRNHNQATGYVTTLILPPAALIVAKHNKTEKDRLDLLQVRNDRLILLARLKRC